MSQETESLIHLTQIIPHLILNYLWNSETQASSLYLVKNILLIHLLS